MLDKLCSIIHPIVIDEISTAIKRTARSGKVTAVVIDAPLLIEAGLHKIADYLIVVKTSQATQVKRAIKKTGLGKTEILRRIRSQMALNKKIQMADYVVDNEGGKNKTKKIVKEIWREIIETTTYGAKCS